MVIEAGVCMGPVGKYNKTPTQIMATTTRTENWNGTNMSKIRTRSRDTDRQSRNERDQCGDPSGNANRKRKHNNDQVAAHIIIKENPDSNTEKGNVSVSKVRNNATINLILVGNNIRNKTQIQLKTKTKDCVGSTSETVSSDSVQTISDHDKVYNGRNTIIRKLSSSRNSPAKSISTLTSRINSPAPRISIPSGRRQADDKPTMNNGTLGCR